MAKAKKLKCDKCGKKFSMPAHLARHMLATHGIGTPAKRGHPPAPRITRRFPGSLEGLSAALRDIAPIYRQYNEPRKVGHNLKVVFRRQRFNDEMRRKAERTLKAFLKKKGFRSESFAWTTSAAYETTLYVALRCRVLYDQG